MPLKSHVHPDTAVCAAFRFGNPKPRVCETRYNYVFERDEGIGLEGTLLDVLYGVIGGDVYIGIRVGICIRVRVLASRQCAK